MTTATLLSLIVVKMLILSVGVLAACLLFRFVPIRSPGLCRLIWGGVLLLGVFGAGLPVTIPITEEQSQVQSAEFKVQSINHSELLTLNVEQATVPVFEQSIMPALDGVYASDFRETPIAESGIQSNNHFELCTLHSELSQYLYPALLFVWLTGIATLLTRRLVHYCRLLKHLKTARPVQGDDLLLWQTMLREHNIRSEKLALWTTSGIGPALVRTPRGTVVVVPNDLWQDTDERIKSGILRHELAHDRRHDLAVCGVVRWLTILHWFNPLAWLAASKFEEATEWACDVAAFGHDLDGEWHFAESMIALHDVTPSITLNDFAFRGGKLTRRAELLKMIITQPKESAMKKIVLSVLVLSLLLAGMVHVRFDVRANEMDETTTQQSDNGGHGVTALSENDTEFEQRMKDESLAAARKAFDNALDELKGDILSGTHEQQIMLVGHADYYAGMLWEAGQKDEVRELALRILDWNEKLIQAADQMENNEDDDKEWLLHQVSGTWSLFAMLGMDDAAVNMAKATIMEGQYNAAEYLTNLARTVARRDGFQRAIPILDEAIVAANTLSREFWRERGIIDVAEVYAEVGRENTSRELIAPGAATKCC